MARQNFSRELEFGKKLKKTISISIFTDIKTIFKKQMKIKEIKMHNKVKNSLDRLKNRLEK